ncbi:MULTISPECIES: HAD-IA family hydrolase [Acinetobacter]|uniref:HAD-IA family hydrolase n=1 Tax=Acinetobacter TaxID=469 RepID=UPI000CDE4CB2|nr:MULTISPECIES: HAD-IA family hydrolase [Acinetobacter]MCU4324038.1 HAD-IA family hydrolase [Acinetobacter schindleri]POU15977.1 HAD family hydrolase [Acinetobacter sp. ACNIH3]POV73986.1 HAD family hydrolase [Acinetobacter sp. ACNIH4]QIC60868.1 HAD-IA family hydrolase [Acinetobacter schindleri]WDE15708.1 HAD-IA family hydrolase [Acinetobacter schindleri]
MNSPVKLVIFDWDGTLFDSVGQIVASLQFAAQQFNQPLTDADAKSIIGLGLPEVAQRLFPAVPELHADILQAYSEHYVANSVEDAWFEGVSEMLYALKDQGIKLAVATGKSRKGLDRVLKQTNSLELFHATRAASETRSKPDPLMLAEILAETGIHAHEAIMVGDTSYDLEMALNIVMPSVGVSYGVHTSETLANFNPLSIVNDVSSLHEFLLAKVQWKEAI